VAQPLRNLAAEAAVDDRLRLVRPLPRRVVEVVVEGPPGAAGVDGVAVAGGDQHPGLGPAASQRRVDADRVPVVEGGHRVGVFDQSLQRRDRSHRLVLRRRQDLRPDDLTGLLVDAHRIGEGAADVHAHSDRHSLLLS